MNPVRPDWFYTDVLRSEKDRTPYTGTTSNLKKRLKEHNGGLDFSTKHKIPLKLIHFEACSDKSDTYRREKYLKSGMGKKYLNSRINGGLTG